MTEVLIERHPETPLSAADAADIIESGNDCRAIHRLAWNGSFLSSDGQQMICHLTSPDVESVRIALRKASKPMPADVWACSVHDSAGLTREELARANVLASFRFQGPAEPEELEAILGFGSICLSNQRARVLRSFIGSDRRRVICLCSAADAESVRIALRDSKPPVDRIWAFRQFNS